MNANVCLDTKLLLFFLTGVLLLVLETACGGGSHADPSPHPIPVVSHVFVLVEENHSFGQVIGNTIMPYTNSLAQKYSLATQYSANRYNSLPNYFMLTVGDLITTDDSYTGTVTSDNVVRALTNAGKSWKVYADSLPSAGYLGTSQPPYGRDHNPFTYLQDVINSSSQAANVVPFTQLATDIQNNTLPDYAMIVPDFINDGHDCPTTIPNCADSDKLQHVDTWVSQNIDPLIKSAAFSDGVLVYTWDESDVNDLTNPTRRVATILVGSKVKTGYQSTTPYQHQSTLKLTMQLLGVKDYPGLAASAPDMNEFF
jgi:phospholipase C